MKKIERRPSQKQHELKGQKVMMSVSNVCQLYTLFFYWSVRIYDASAYRYRDRKRENSSRKNKYIKIKEISDKKSKKLIKKNKKTKRYKRYKNV